MKRRLLIALIGLFAVAALYVLSVGPVVLVYQKARLWQTSPDLASVLRILYAPLEALATSSSPFGGAYRAYVKLWSGIEVEQPTR
jgi:hypothetical protein